MKQTWWMRLTERLRGRRHQITMRVIHRFGWCWPQATPIRPGAVWCHWCGMRGQKPVTLCDSIPYRDADRESANSVYSGGTDQEGA